MRLKRENAQEVFRAEPAIQSVSGVAVAADTTAGQGD